MLRPLAFAFTIIFFLASCSKPDQTSETPADSTTLQTSGDDSLLPVYVYNRASTYEGQFNTQLQTTDSAQVDREGLIALSASLEMDQRKDLTVRGGNFMELKLVMFRQHAPVLKLTNCRNITFVNVSFSAQYANQHLVELSNCTNITFEHCTFMFDEAQSIAQRDNENVVFNECTFGGPGSAAEEPSLEEQSDETSEENSVSAEMQVAGEEESEEETASEETEEDPATEQFTYPTGAWTSGIATLSVPRQQENLGYFAANQYFNVRDPGQMNYASYSVLEFGRDFLSPVDWTQETETWKEGSDVVSFMPDNCPDYDKVLSLTRTRRKLWYIHRKLSFEQEYGIDAQDRWRDDAWYRNRSYYAFLFDDRSATMMEQVWNAVKPFISGEVTITRQEYNDALLFIDELLLYHAKVEATPFWEDRFYYLGNMDVNLSAAEYFYEAGFPLHDNLCMREGYSGGNYITGYDWGNEAWMYGFWLRRHREGNMEMVKNILLWAKAELLRRSGV
ncbi:hypothetical protein KK083_24785 [Fulvivirgaceae bacterium PWU4]|uniref:Uncharacterized protein n=1 Tax=Chryseosolibacter histidini TaxID=2782349 RepID=A0AAP2DPH5_9BACT|nr:right-handed parallel beta-helix repeat-containing protein [Chryseosolibacter histidini]MBT1700128.1 hypothetical protein [Chryseosolibacter histidini]